MRPNVIAVAVLALSAAGAQADATFDLGTVAGYVPVGNTVFAGSFVDTYSFSVASLSTVEAVVLNTSYLIDPSALSLGKISFFAASLDNVPLALSVVTTPLAPGVDKVDLMLSLPGGAIPMFATGTHTLSIAGIGDATGPQYTGSLTVSAIPEPSHARRWRVWVQWASLRVGAAAPERPLTVVLPAMPDGKSGSGRSFFRPCGQHVGRARLQRRVSSSWAVAVPNYSLAKVADSPRPCIYLSTCCIPILRQCMPSPAVRLQVARTAAKRVHRYDLRSQAPGCWPRRPVCSRATGPAPLRSRSPPQSLHRRCGHDMHYHSPRDRVARHRQVPQRTRQAAARRESSAPPPGRSDLPTAPSPARAAGPRR